MKISWENPNGIAIEKSQTQGSTTMNTRKPLTLAAILSATAMPSLPASASDVETAMLRCQTAVTTRSDPYMIFFDVRSTDAGTRESPIAGVSCRPVVMQHSTKNCSSALSAKALPPCDPHASCSRSAPSSTNHGAETRWHLWPSAENRLPA